MKYLAFLDILGFKELVEKNELDELERLYERMEGSVLYSMAVTNPEHTLSEIEGLPGIEETNLNSMVISDSIILLGNDNCTAPNGCCCTSVATAKRDKNGNLIITNPNYKLE